MSAVPAFTRSPDLTKIFVICPSTWGFSTTEWRDLSVPRYSEDSEIGTGSNDRRLNGDGGRLLVTSSLFWPQPERTAEKHKSASNPQRRVLGVDTCGRCPVNLRGKHTYISVVGSRLGYSYCTGCARLLQAWWFLEHYTDRRANRASLVFDVGFRRRKAPVDSYLRLRRVTSAADKRGATSEQD